MRGPRVEEAFIAFYDTHWGSVYRALVRRVGATDAQDVAQEVWAVVYRRWKTLNTESGNPRAWLFSVVASKAKDHLRSRARAIRAIERLKLESEGSADDPAMEVTALEWARRCARDVGARSEADGELILMLIEERSVSEIAAALGVSENAATTRIHRMRRLLTEHGLRAPEMQGEDRG